MPEQKAYYSNPWIAGALVLTGFLVPFFLISTSSFEELSLLNSIMAALIAITGWSLGWILWRVPLVTMNKSRLSSNFRLFSRSVSLDQIRGFKQDRFSIVLFLENGNEQRIWTLFLSDKKKIELAKRLLSYAQTEINPNANKT
ncbi:hypothetical protein GF406_26135 [candidate division KSB1 bacterium]|nr:hypothetical protein [candidate division KSB1 bacterium]